MVWLWIAAWFVLALAVSLAVVQSVRLANRRSVPAPDLPAPAGEEPNFVVDEEAPPAARMPRHRSAQRLRADLPHDAARSRPRSRRG